MRLLPISALQHLLFCERQCALIHLEQLWAENQFTAEGNLMHEKAHSGISNLKFEISDQPTRIARGLEVRSEVLGLSGQCDIVEFRAAGPSGFEISDLKFQIQGTVLPVEYKRGKPKAHRADEVQLCAQALCLEEMLETRVPEGRLFYGQTRRRTDVVFDAELRSLTAAAAERLHELMESGRTPAAVFEERKCGNCSLIELCMPKAQRFKRGADSWFTQQLQDLRFEI